MNVVHSSRLPASLGKVAQAICSEPYNLEVERGREGVVSTEFRVAEQDERKAVFELRTTEYKRTKTGGIDKSATFVSVTRSELDKQGNVLRWSYAPESGSSRIKLSGETRLAGDGGATTVAHDVRIEVEIPLIGGQIAKLIARQFQASLARTDDILRKHACA